MGTPLTASVAAIVFSVLGLWFAGRVVAGRDVPDRVSNLLHLLMSGSMLAMPWSWDLPALPQVVVFSAGAFWYAGAALFRPSSDARLGLGHGVHGRVAGLWYHAGMMLAMVWMAVAMIPATASTDGGGMVGMTRAAPAGTALTGDVPWALGVSIALGACFAGAAVWLAVLLIREAAGAAHHLEVADLAASTVMAAGMSFVLLVVLT